MNANVIGRHAARALAVVLLACAAAIGLTACQTATVPAAPEPLDRTTPRPFDRTLSEKYRGRSADRIAEAIEREIGARQLPSPGCLSHHVVEHPAGGYHLVCIQVRE